MADRFYIVPIGIVEKNDDKTYIRVYDSYTKGLLGIDGFSHIHVLYWFHENDTQDKRHTLQVHPRRDPHNPLTGVFATHSPVRPNLIALSLCKIVSVRGNRIEIESIDARNESPVIDIKAYIPYSVSPSDIVLPDWV